MADGLVDELHLWTCPIVLGSGKRLFPDGGETRALELLEATTRDGVASLRFRSA
jgi:dihydrofolate reductase